MQNPCLITWKSLGRDQVTWLVAVRLLQPNWGPLVTTKESLILWGLFFLHEAFVIVSCQVGLCLVSMLSLAPLGCYKENQLPVRASKSPERSLPGWSTLGEEEERDWQLQAFCCCSVQMQPQKMRFR